MPQPKENEHFTYADYLAQDENSERMELIDGKVYMMSCPTTAHQSISMELGRQLANFLVGKQCRVFAAPFDVRLFEKEGDKPDNVDTVVQPDIFVVCDKSKIDNHGIKGAPNLVIEILSPTTYRHDCLVKLNLYLRAGVPEYWLVEPEEKTILVYLLGDDGAYHVSKQYVQNDTVEVNVLKGCFIELSKVFADI